MPSPPPSPAYLVLHGGSILQFLSLQGFGPAGVSPSSQLRQPAPRPRASLRAADVVVDAVSGRIAAICNNSAETEAFLEGLHTHSTFINIRDRIVMPGMLDAHVHVTASSADLRAAASTLPSLMTARAVPILQGMIRRGFTTVRDCGGADAGLAAAIEEGTIELAPRVLFCGKALSPTGGHGDFRGAGEPFLPLCRCCQGGNSTIGRVADGVDAVREAVRDEVRKGAAHIKVMASGGVSSPTDRITNLQYSEDELRAIVDEAAMAGLGVAAHAYTSEAIRRAVKAGVRSIEHGNLADEEAIADMLAAHAFLVPTIITYERLREEGEQAGMPRELVHKVGDLVERGVDVLRMAEEKGLPIAYGSDLLGAMHPYQAAGIALHLQAQSPSAVLAALTIGPARLFDLEDEIGVIKRGAIADLLVVAGGDVTSDPTILMNEENLVYVVKSGRIVVDRS
ncbi:amidohydrolase [Pycnococcus provasolii]